MGYSHLLRVNLLQFSCKPSRNNAHCAKYGIDFHIIEEIFAQEKL
jgi:hypothetical protein